MKILLIEDEDSTRELLVEALSAARYAVEQAADGELGLELASLWAYDLILLDLQIPKLDGLNVCRQLRNRGITTPILMLTAQDAQEDIITGLDTGADDYVTKPFEVSQVLARIRALLRRGATASSPTPLLRWGKLCLDPATTTVTYGNQPIALTPKEYSLLELFLRNPQRVFSRSTILDHLWSMDDSPTEGAVTNLVKDLRNRLKRNGLEEAVIQTVYGLGYRLKSIGTQPAAKAAETTATTKHSLPSPGTLASIATRFQRSIQQRVEVLEDATRALQSGGIAPPQRELAGEEAHRLAGGLGTFGYAQGSALARQIEQLLQRAGPLDRGAIAQLSQHLLALKQAVVGQPTPTPVAPDQVDSIATLGLPNSILLPLQSLSSVHNWTIEPFDQVDDLLHQTKDKVIGVVLLYLDPQAEPTQKWAALEQLKRRWPHRPVTVFSTTESLEERVQAVRLGADRYLVMPIFPEQLWETLTDLLTQPQPVASRVMVVEDDPRVCATIVDLLTPWGLQVTILEDPGQFWQVLRQTDPDILLLGQELPTFSGVELCQVVRTDGQYGDLPILMMTTQPNHMAVQQLFELGCDDLINKPIISPELITRVLSRIERSRLRQQLDTLRQQQTVYWHRQEHFDPVTLVANGRYFDTFLQQQWERHRQDQAPIALILCTPDWFETYQNNQGLEAADQLLRRLALVLQSTINPNIDLVARYSDTVFGIVLPNTNLDSTLRVVNRIQQAIQPIPMGPLGASDLSCLTLSLGIGGTTPTATQRCDDLLKAADQALKASQSRGGDTFCLYPM